MARSQGRKKVRPRAAEFVVFREDALGSDELAKMRAATGDGSE